MTAVTNKSSALNTPKSASPAKSNSKHLNLKIKRKNLHYYKETYKNLIRLLRISDILYSLLKFTLKMRIVRTHLSTAYTHFILSLVIFSKLPQCFCKYSRPLGFGVTHMFTVNENSTRRCMIKHGILSNKTKAKEYKCK